MSNYQAAYDLNQGFTVATGGFLDDLNEGIKAFVQNNHQLVFGALVVMSLVIVYHYMHKESFNPGQTLRAVQRDDTGATNDVQNQGVGIIASEQNIVAPKPGTIPYEILHDTGFNCAGRIPVGNDAWAWMTNVANTPGEAAIGNRGANTDNVPLPDNSLSKIMAGH